MAEKVGSVLVVGGGIAGIQASLDLVELGYKVYLVEEKPSIGGVMAQLDKTFPTNDCAMCILAPKLVDTGRHPNIAIVPILQDVNIERKYLPENVLRHVAQRLSIPLSQVYNIATFYNAFSLLPRGEHIIHVCLGTACYVKGGGKVLEAFERELNIKAGGTTEDLKFSLETVNCVGCCGQAPVVTIGEDIYGYMKQARVPDVLEKYSLEEAKVGEDKA